MSDWSDPISIHDLPTKIPLFMVRGAIVLPKAHLPLPLFDESHFEMINACLEGNRLIGLIQPSATLKENIELEHIDLFSTGCLAKIINVVEHEERACIAEIEGVIRFRLIEHTLDSTGNYPIATVDYSPYSRDLADEIDVSLDRPRLFKALKPYFNRLEITANWDEIDKTSNHKLLTALSMVCPLPPSEKQALLETESIQERSHVMTTLLEMAAMGGLDTVTHH